MNIPLFLAVWIGTWALCWWHVASLAGAVAFRRAAKSSTPEHAMMNGNEWHRIAISMWHRRAPYVATLAAFALDFIVANW